MSVQHSSVIKLLDVVETTYYIGIVLECIPGGELYNYVDKKHHLDEVEACRSFKQHIHIVHCDLKLLFVIGFTTTIHIYAQDLTPQQPSI
ncbi:hypothetical protein Glove_37g103 [Diversispora epigaea]|uniref:Protein kinase domain-containing protein n=1 Tax=Diversispora epigaea TaxID=1348612 RepID=A0A397JKQ8_9GLOM|nr:hypothetical protein Glove_37g103 [Diversispora epigaea]